jgi:hypothetical protein
LLLLGSENNRATDATNMLRYTDSKMPREGELGPHASTTNLLSPKNVSATQTGIV